ncbi:MAG: hypothetical protein WEA99_02210 [Brumimicrobium sp.]
MVKLFTTTISNYRYQGTKLNKVVGKWPGNDEVEDLLQLLD